MSQLAEKTIDYLIKNDRQNTTIGKIPSEWECGRLEKFLTVLDCKHVTAKFTATGWPLASIREVQSRFVDLSEANRTDEQFYLQLIGGGRKPQPGDLILSRNATVGEVAQVTDWHPPFAMGQDVCLLRPKRRDMSTVFCQAVILSDLVRDQIENIMVGSTFRRINIQQIRSLIVPLPSHAEQEAIASALGDADALIESLEQLLAKKRLIKQGAMQELLTGKRRLPGFECKGSQQTELGSIPADWGIRRIGQLADKVGSGITPRGGSANYRSSGRPFVRSQNVGWGVLDLSELVFIDDAIHATFSASELELDDVLLNITGASIGRCAIANKKLVRGNVNQHVCIIRLLPSEAHPSFIQQQLVSRIGQDQIDSFQAGGNREGLNFGQIRSMQLPLPASIDEQRAISGVLSEMQAEVDELSHKLAKVRGAKQAMMQQLLTGRIRLM